MTQHQMYTIKYVSQCGFHGERNVMQESIRWQDGLFRNRLGVDMVCELRSIYIADNLALAISQRRLVSLSFGWCRDRHV